MCIQGEVNILPNLESVLKGKASCLLLKGLTGLVVQRAYKLACLLLTPFNCAMQDIKNVRVCLPSFNSIYILKSVYPETRKRSTKHFLDLS